MVATTPVIGLKGVMHSGKSEAAKYLVARYGYTRIRFAGPLKSMLAAFLRESGVDEDTIFRMIDGDLKEVPSKFLGGRSPRYAMQTLGTEWGRELMSPSLWGDAASLNIDQLRAAGKIVVIDDCRFPNERDIIMERGGFVFEMKNAKLRSAASGGHASEAMDFPSDFLIAHDGVNLATLHAALDYAVIEAMRATGFSSREIREAVAA